MKKIIVFLLFLNTTSFLCADMYDAVLNQLTRDISSNKNIVNSLSHNLRDTYLGFINKSVTLKKKYDSLADQLKAISQPVVQKTILEKRLDDVAINQGYGYKYANLVELKTPCGLISRQALSYTMAVPEFAGIPSQNIQKFLKENASFDITQRWAAIIKKYFPNRALQQQTINTKSYPADFLQECLQLEAAIKSAFNQIAQKNNTSFSFNNAFGIDDMDQAIK